jgi:hypothetical protein
VASQLDRVLFSALKWNTITFFNGKGTRISPCLS